MTTLPVTGVSSPARKMEYSIEDIDAPSCLSLFQYEMSLKEWLVSNVK
jgi:hypothetical protein